jgi:DNA-binding NarL/FixJ family response regulator
MAKPTKHRSKPVVRVLIADAYPFFRSGLRAFLADVPGFAVTGESGDAQELLRLCQADQPDVVLLAVDLPGFDGSIPIGLLRDRAPKAKYIALGMPGDEEVLAAVVDSGLDGCVMKNADPPTILSAVRAVSAGGTWLQRELTGELVQELRKTRHSAGRRDVTALSKRESEVLSLLAEGLRNAQIAKRLFISERTVKVHVSKIFDKLQLRDRVQAARYAIRTGLVRP